MRPFARTVTVGLTVFSLLGLGLAVAVSEAGAVATLPTTINEVVAPSGTIGATCPSGLAAANTGSVFGDLASAVTAVSSGGTIYVCAGTYDMSVTASYGSNEQVIINKALTIDGYNWNVAPSGSDTSASVNGTTQSVFENGSGILVQSPNVTIQGLTFSQNNATATNLSGPCNSEACVSSITVMSLVSGAGDQGEASVTIHDNFFSDTGGSGTHQSGEVHFGLGDGFSVSEPTTDVTALDAGDVVSSNVFVVDSGFVNNALQMSDTTGASVTGNTVNYPTNNGSGSDDAALSALWFPGFDQATTITGNTLNGGGIDNDSGATPNTGDPKSGIKVIDSDSDGNYGKGCSSQVVSNNTVSGFVYDISMISTGYTAGTSSLCPIGPVDFTVSNNTVSNARVYGIYISVGSAGGSTISGNVASNTDTEGETALGYPAGEYDFFDAAAIAPGNTSGNTWSSNSGNGTSFPAGINETSTTTTTTSTTTSTTSTTSTTTTTMGGGGGGGGGGTTTTTSSTTTTTLAPPPPTTTTTLARKAATIATGSKITTGDKVFTIVHCSNARCAGTLELTKKVGKIVELFGKSGYSAGAGSAHQFSIVLNANGKKYVRSTIGHHFTLELTITSSGVTRHEYITLILA